MEEHWSVSAETHPQRREFGSARGLIHMADDFDSPLPSESALGEDAVTSKLEQAIRAAKELSEEDQDALAAEILEWIDNNRRWADSFARTHEALAELACEALAEHHAGQTRDLEADYTEMAADNAREGEAAEWSEGLLADAVDEADDPSC